MSYRPLSSYCELLQHGNEFIVEDMDYKALQKRSKKTKINAKTGRVEQQGLKKCREEGHLESLSESVVNLVRSGHFSIEAALDILKVSADIRSTVKENAEKALSK